MNNDYILEITSLACAILNKEKLNKIINLSEDDYFNNNCRIVFIAIKDLYNAGKETDLISVRSKLSEKQTNIPDTFLAEIMQTYPVSDVDGLIQTLRQYTQKRKILNLKNNLNDFENKKINNEKIINDIYSELELIEKINNESFNHISKYCERDISYFELKENDFEKTGFIDLDKIIFGLVKSELTILGARTGLGKSSFALNVALNISKRKRVLYFSLEMLAKQLCLRALSGMAFVDSYMIRRGEINDIEMKNLINSSLILKDRLLYFDDNSFGLDQILSKIRKFHSLYKDVIIVVDYIQMIKVPWIEQKRLKVCEISGSFKQICNKLNIPILALAQLSRNAENQVPRLSDLKEAGSLEEDADNIIFLHNTIEMGNIYDFYVAKGRSCGTGSGQLIFDKKTTTFKNYERLT